MRIAKCGLVVGSLLVAGLASCSKEEEAKKPLKLLTRTDTLVAMALYREEARKSATTFTLSSDTSAIDGRVSRHVSWYGPDLSLFVRCGGGAASVKAWRTPLLTVYIPDGRQVAVRWRTNLTTAQPDYWTSDGTNLLPPSPRKFLRSLRDADSLFVGVVLEGGSGADAH